MRISDWSSDVCSSDLRISPPKANSQLMRMSTRVKKASSRSISQLSPAPATKTLFTAFAEVFHSFRTEFSPEPAHKVHAQGGNYITTVLYTTSTDVIASQGEKVALFSVSRFSDTRSFVDTVRPDLPNHE